MTDYPVWGKWPRTGLPRDTRYSDIVVDNDVPVKSDKKLYINNAIGSVELDILNQTVFVVADSPIIVRLPCVSEARGLVFKITALSLYPSTSVIVTDHFSDSVSWPGDYLLDVEGDYIQLTSNGRSWTVVVNGISP